MEDVASLWFFTHRKDQKTPVISALCNIRVLRQQQKQTAFYHLLSDNPIWCSPWMERKQPHSRSGMVRINVGNKIFYTGKREDSNHTEMVWSGKMDKNSKHKRKRSSSTSSSPTHPITTSQKINFRFVVYSFCDGIERIISSYADLSFSHTLTNIKLFEIVSEDWAFAVWCSVANGSNVCRMSCMPYHTYFVDKIYRFRVWYLPFEFIPFLSFSLSRSYATIKALEIECMLSNINRFVETRSHTRRSHFM